MQVQELVTIVPWQFIATIANLFIQVYLIKRFLLKPVREVLDKRRVLADAQMQEAQENKAQALAMKAEYEQHMVDAQALANEIITAAQKTAVMQSEGMIREASSQVSAIKEKAEKDIAKEKRRAINEIKNEISGMVIELAGKVMEREICEADHEKLIDEFIANVGERL